jgi:hypothetical protein
LVYLVYLVYIVQFIQGNTTIPRIPTKIPKSQQFDQKSKIRPKIEKCQKAKRRKRIPLFTLVNPSIDRSNK